MTTSGKENFRLKSYKNKSLNPDEMRRRREEEGLQLRKQKREEQVLYYSCDNHNQLLNICVLHCLLFLLLSKLLCLIVLALSSSYVVSLKSVTCQTVLPLLQEVQNVRVLIIHSSVRLTRAAWK